MRFRLDDPQVDLFPAAMSGARRACGSHGLVGRCRRRDPAKGLPAVPVYVATGPRRDTLGYPLRTVPIGTGVSDNDEVAWLQAVVEVLERFCLLWPGHREAVIRAAADELGERAIPPRAFGLFSPEQYSSLPGLRLPQPHEPLDWTRGWSLTRDEPVLVPAALVLGSVTAGRPNDFVHSLSSTGVAAHVSVTAAVLSGLLEVIERDAVMLTWLHRRTPPRLEVDTGAPAILTELFDRYLRLDHFRVELVDLTADSGLPTIACLALCDDPSRPAAVMGSATRLDPVEAVRKALFEAAQILSSLALLGCDARSALADHAAVRTFDDHARYYAGTEAAATLGFLTASNLPVPVSSLSPFSTGSLGADLASAVDAAARTGMEVVVVDLTTPEVARLGFHTLKVLAPPALDINADVRYPLLGSERIRTVPERMGWQVLPDGALNLQPCPLA